MSTSEFRPNDLGFQFFGAYLEGWDIQYPQKMLQFWAPWVKPSDLSAGPLSKWLTSSCPAKTVAFRNPRTWKTNTIGLGWTTGSQWWGSSLVSPTVSHNSWGSLGFEGARGDDLSERHWLCSAKQQWDPRYKLVWNPWILSLYPRNPP